MHHSKNRSNSENTPPSNNKSKVRRGIQGSSSRRRVRSVGGPNHPRYAFPRAKQENSVSPDDMAIATTAITGTSLPRYLRRPAFRQISKATIAAAAPELAGTALNYIREGLECLGPHMLKVLAGVKAEPSPAVLDTQLEVVVNDVSSDTPTHMLAVYARHVTGAKRHVTLFPIHNIIMATHCANLPILPESKVPCASTAGSTLSVPVVPLCLPAPDVFPQLSTFLYTKRIDHLLASILPYPVPYPLYCHDPTNKRVCVLLQRFSFLLAKDHDIETLLGHVMTVNGVWRNACALGIDDEKLWCALDVAWEVLITALGIATGRRL